MKYALVWWLKQAKSSVVSPSSIPSTSKSEPSVRDTVVVPFGKDQRYAKILKLSEDFDWLCKLDVKDGKIVELTKKTQKDMVQTRKKSKNHCTQVTALNKLNRRSIHKLKVVAKHPKERRSKESLNSETSSRPSDVEEEFQPFKPLSMNTGGGSYKKNKKSEKKKVQNETLKGKNEHSSGQLHTDSNESGPEIESHSTVNIQQKDLIKSCIPSDVEVSPDMVTAIAQKVLRELPGNENSNKLEMNSQTPLNLRKHENIRIKTSSGTKMVRTVSSTPVVGILLAFCIRHAMNRARAFSSLSNLSTKSN